MRRHLLGSVVLFSLIGILILASNVRLARTESVTIIVPDDFLTIQEAINNASAGDTILVKTGTYYEHIVVNKTVSLVGEDSNATIIDGNWTGRVIEIVSDNVNVTGFTVQRSGSVGGPGLDAGFCLNGVTGCTIYENRVIENGFCGISLHYSQQNTITRNEISNTTWGGIHLLTSSSNTISRNVLTNNTYVGINGHASSHYNNITENIIANGTYGMFFHNANQNNISRNDISRIGVEGIWFQEQVSYNIIAENCLTNCSVGIKLFGPNYDNVISGNFLANGQSGIRIQNAGYTEIYNNIITHNYGVEWDAGIRLDSADHSIIHSNLITDNWRGILLYTNSPYVSIYNNNITDNEFAIRVASGGSNYLNVSDNLIINNRGYGIGLTGFGGASNYATISRNFIVNNSDGIALGQYSNYNTIFQNNISHNGYGFYAEYSTQNRIWGNNILDNDQQVNVSTGSINNWDSGYPAGGNYWTDYNGVDLDPDGIGDTEYVVDADNIDHYPLMGMFSDLRATSEHHVQTICNSTLSDFQFNGTAISFNVTGEDDTTGFCRICIPKALMNGTFNVFVNGTEILPAPEPLPFSNNTHNYLYFTYSHSTQEVTITPEFPSFLLLPLFMIATLLIIIIRKRKTASTLSRERQRALQQ